MTQIEEPLIGEDGLREIQPDVIGTGPGRTDPDDLLEGIMRSPHPRHDPHAYCFPRPYNMRIPLDLLLLPPAVFAGKAAVV